MTKLLVLDKDGTLVRPKSGNTFVQHPEDQELIEGVAEAIQRYVADGWQVAIASNQGGCSTQKCKAADFPVGAYYEGSKVVGKQILPLGVVVLKIPDDRPSPRFAPDHICEFQYKTLDDAIAEMRYAMKLTGIEKAQFCPNMNGDLMVVVTQGQVWDIGIDSIRNAKSFRKPDGGMLTWLEAEYHAKLMVGDMQSDIDAGLVAGYEVMWAHEWRKNMGESIFDESKYYFGRICKHGHNWNNTGHSLRWRSGRSCVECSKIQQKKHYYANLGNPERIAYLKSEARKATQHNWNTSDRGRKIKNDWAKSEAGQNYMNGDKRKAAAKIKDRKYAQTKEGKNSRLKAQSRYRLRNKQLLNARTLLYRQTPRGKEVHRAIQQRRIARKKQNPIERYSATDIDALREAFDNLCAYCGEKEASHIDHFLPVSGGGPDALNNLIPCCVTCNCSKSNKPPDVWFKSRSFYSEDAWLKILKVLNKTEETP